MAPVKGFALPPFLFSEEYLRCESAKSALPRGAAGAGSMMTNRSL